MHNPKVDIPSPEANASSYVPRVGAWDKPGSTLMVPAPSFTKARNLELITRAVAAAPFVAGASFYMEEIGSQEIINSTGFSYYYSLTVKPNLEIREDLSVRFAALAKQWKEDTEFSSDAYMMADHPAYKEIIAMDRPAIRLILAEMQREPDHWFWALCRITKADPVLPEHAGNIKKMTKDWLRWGKDNGFIDG